MLSVPVLAPGVAVVLVGNLGLLTALGPSVFRVSQASGGGGGGGSTPEPVPPTSRLPPHPVATATRGCAGHRWPAGSGASPPALTAEALTCPIDTAPYNPAPYG